MEFVLLRAAAVNVCEATIVRLASRVDYIVGGMRFGGGRKELCSGMTRMELSCGGTLLGCDARTAH